MSTLQAKRVTDFLSENPGLQGHCLAYRNPNETGKLWFSRINDGWWDQEDFWIQATAVIDWHEMVVAEKVSEALDRIEKANILIDCEPDCDKVRHAYHEGSWKTYQSVEAEITVIRKELNDRT